MQGGPNGVRYLFWVRDHHVAVHEYARDGLCDAREHGSAYRREREREGWSGVGRGCLPTYGDVGHEMATVG